MRSYFGDTTLEGTSIGNAVNGGPVNGRRDGAGTLSNAECKTGVEADEWLKRNQAIPHEVVLREPGLTMADW